MPAFYSTNIQSFLSASEEAIIGALSNNYEQAGYYQLISKQTAA
jgi:hypothetical protein